MFLLACIFSRFATIGAFRGIKTYYLFYKNRAPLSKAVAVPEQYDRLMEGSRLVHSGLRVQFPKSRQAILTALYRDAALFDRLIVRPLLGYY